jgi:putative Mn2+ efflux pump MntP
MSFKTLIIAFLLSLSVSVDDMAVGVSYGLRRVRMQFLPMVTMVMGSTISMLFAMELAKLLTASLSHTVTTYMAAVLLTALGCGTLYRGRRECLDRDVRGEKSENSLREGVPLWESFYLGLALGVDDFAEAVGLALAGFPILLTVGLFKLSEVITVLLGAWLGYHGVTKVLRCRLRYIPGIVLILVGLYQLF